MIAFGEVLLQMLFVSDEKNFVLIQAPNRHNDRIWAVENPHAVCEIKDQSAKKVMAFVCLIDGRALPVVWFEKQKPSDKVSVTQASYVKMLKEKIFLPLYGRGTWSILVAAGWRSGACCWCHYCLPSEHFWGEDHIKGHEKGPAKGHCKLALSFP